MKIAYILPSLANKGPIKVVHELVNNLLQKNGIIIDIYYFDDIHELNFASHIKKITFLHKIGFDDYDILHSHGIRPDAYLWYHRKIIKKSKCITTLHNYVKIDLAHQYNPFISMIFSPLWNLFTSKHDGIVVLSQDAKKYYESFWLNKNITVINNGIKSKEDALEPLSTNIVKKVKSAKEEGKTIIGAIGLLTTRKGFDQLLYAIAKDKKLFLILIGDGKERDSLINMTNELAIQDRVVFLGYQPNANKYFEIFDIVTIPSRSEGFPIALLEAARAKKSLVCSDIPVLKEILSPNEVSFFKLEDIDSLVIAISDAITNKSSREQNIYTRFKEQYTSEIMSEKYLSLYQVIINE